MYLLLSVIGPAAALVLARRFDLGLAATAVTVLLGLAPTYLAWASFRASQAEADLVDLDKIVGDLAVAVRNQWESEAAIRRVNDPYPLPVAWRAASGDLAEPWPFLAELVRAWPGGPPGDLALWPPDASGLEGRDAEIGQVFLDRVPTRRLVILGEPGSGKSVLLIRLLQDLIARRTAADPVPMLFSLASWDPRQPLKAWMADQLRRTHPGLVAAAPSRAVLTATAADGPGDLALYLLNAGRILPLFDGFDELPPAQHATALDLLNRALPASQPLALTSRTAPYRAALARPGTTVRLNGAAALQLCPLDAQAAADYLRRDAGGPHTSAAERWTTVVTQLGTGSAVGRALSTPLGLFLARTIYNPRPGTSPGSAPVPHPDELCDTIAFPERAAIDTHLFSAFIPAAYTPHQAHPPRWTAEQAHDTFVFLARFLHHHRAGSPDLAWWELPTAIPRHIRHLAGLPVGPAVGLIFGLIFEFTAGLGTGIAAGLGTGLAAGLVVRRADSPKLGIRLRFSPSGLAAGLRRGLVVGVVAGIGLVVIGGSGLTAEHLGFDLVIVLGIGIGIGIAGGLAAGVKADEPDLTVSADPATLHALDRRAFLVIGLASGLAAGLVAWIVLGLMSELWLGLAVWGAAWLAAGLAFGLKETAWGHFALARAYLAVRHHAPRDLMAFLQDAHEQRGVLRQVGPVYQFRHIDLQHHLAQYLSASSRTP
ncbi:NACHT domain-containing protein [Streptomyces mirabilis]|uniref:NACHT domain-containing protein n=1 Tax=Streptomyces mirabilis TaxID=68239 RepID=UPI0036B72AFF